MFHAFSRTEKLIGKEGLKKLKNSKVAIFGIGGVGSFAVEALARTGIGSLVLIDYDCISLTNLNRQIHANLKTIGRPKVEVMMERILDINPNLNVVTHRNFYNQENADILLNSTYDYVIDAIDSIRPKIDLVIRCKEKGLPIISSMGAGNKLDPTAFEVTDIFKTSVDPIARIMRYELRKKGIQDLKVVFSKEVPIRLDNPNDSPNFCDRAKKENIMKHSTPGSIAFIPSVVGLILAGEVIKDLLK